MKILSLRVEQFKKFDDAVMVGDFGDGLNLIAGPNETGKSTLLLALRAALFERHGAKTQAVKDFSPHHVTGARPTVTLAFETGGERYLLEKKFLKRPSARLETASGQRFEGSEAEAELKRLLGLDPSEKTTTGKDSPAQFGVLLTPQAHSFQLPDLADRTRHNLEAAIAADIAELGSQSEVDSLLAEFQKDRAELIDGHGKKRGRYKEVDIRLKEVEREIAEIALERNALLEQTEQLARAIAVRGELQAADIRENLPERLAALETARAQAAARQTLENRRLAAAQRLQAAEAKNAARRSRTEERQRIADEIERLGKAFENAQHRLGMIEESVGAREALLADLGERWQAASRRRRDLEALGHQVDRLRQVETTLAALATEVRLDLRPETLDRVTLNGEPPIDAGERRQVTEGLAIDIDGIGRIGIEPKIEPMRQALSAKASAERAIGSLLSKLDLGDREPEAIDAALQAIGSEVGEIENARADLEAQHADERRQAAEASAAVTASDDQRTRLMQRLAEVDAAIGGDSDDQTALDAEIGDAKAALDAAESALQATPQSQGSGASPGAVPVEAEITGLRARIEERRRIFEEAGRTVLALEAEIGVRAGLGLDEKIDQLERQRHRLAEERDAFALDDQALSLLQSTLREASDEAKATFNAPLSARLAPYIQDLFPGTTPLVTPAFSIRAIDRDGVEEPFVQLSDGTREQIAVLTRLAFADMLKERGLPALVVLDDALAFSDQTRLDRFFAILEKAAERLQIVVLTCHEERFAGLNAHRLHIAPAAKAELPAA